MKEVGSDNDDEMPRLYRRNYCYDSEESDCESSDEDKRYEEALEESVPEGDDCHLESEKDPDENNSDNNLPELDGSGL